jgi:predicted membrane-bound spermidine synthase
MPRSSAVAPIFITAFLEGACVLVVEIAGARALAPFFGASLQVWTAQITATLLFLALGYGIGGVLCRRGGPHALPAVLWVAGGWLALYPVWRTGTLALLAPLGVSLGALAASSWLFGPALGCLGAVSPLLIARLGTRGIEGGQAAGWLFLTNTLGGLVGGWITALVLVPIASLRWVLAGAGILLAVLGALWSLGRLRDRLLWLLVLIGVGVVAGGPGQGSTLRTLRQHGAHLKVLARVQTPNGLLHVVEQGPLRRLLLNGVNQGGIEVGSGAASEPFSDYLAVLGHRYQPRARRVLLLGLGSGALARTLHGLGLEVTAVEIEPRVVDLAREHFGLPAGVRTVVADARTFLRSSRDRYDLVFLDAFAGESTPWYLLTREALSDAKARLTPSGVLLVNVAAQASGDNPGLLRLEAVLLAVFREARVFVEPRLVIEAEELINATLVASTRLAASAEPYPGTPASFVAPYLGDLAATPLRPARPGAEVDVDDHGAIDSIDADVRQRMRAQVIAAFGPAILAD